MIQHMTSLSTEVNVRLVLVPFAYFFHQYFFQDLAHIKSRWIIEMNYILLSPVSISDKTPYAKISQSLKAVRFVFRIVRSLGNLTPRQHCHRCACPHFKAMRLFEQITRIRDFTKSDDNRYQHGILVCGLNSFAWHWKKRFSCWSTPAFYTCHLDESTSRQNMFYYRIPPD